MISTRDPRVQTTDGAQPSSAASDPITGTARNKAFRSSSARVSMRSRTRLTRARVSRARGQGQASGSVVHVLRRDLSSPREHLDHSVHQPGDERLRIEVICTIFAVLSNCGPRRVRCRTELSVAGERMRLCVIGSLGRGAYDERGHRPPVRVGDFLRPGAAAPLLAHARTAGSLEWPGRKLVVVAHRRRRQADR